MTRRPWARGPAGATTLAAGACTGTTEPRPIRLALDLPDSVIVMEGDSLQLVARLATDADLVRPGTVVWAVRDSSVATISAGGMIRFGRAGRTVVAALSEGLSRTVVVTAAVRWDFLAAGTEYRHFMRWCGLTTRGALYCYTGAFIDIPSDSLLLMTTPPGRRLRQLSLGMNHMCGVAEDDTAWCWGENYHGQLGLDSAVRTYDLFWAPVQVAAGQRFAEISAGQEHTCALTTAGAAWCWGHDWYGRLGNDSVPHTGAVPAPGPVATALSFAHIAAGGHGTCAFTAAGASWCWGANDLGALGTGTPGPSAYVPVRTAGTVPLRSIAAGERHFCGLDAAGDARCWGSNTWGELGVSADTMCSYWHCVPAPARAQSQVTFTQVDTGGIIGFGNNGVTCGLTAAGAAWCWGGNRAGEVGIGTTVKQPLPAAVAGAPSFVSIVVGDFHACGLTADRVAWCWGLYFGMTPTRLPYQP